MRLFVPKIKNWFHVKDKPSIFKKAHSQERKYLHQLRGGTITQAACKNERLFHPEFWAEGENGYRSSFDRGNELGLIYLQKPRFPLAAKHVTDRI